MKTPNEALAKLDELHRRWPRFFLLMESPRFYARLFVAGGHVQNPPPRFAYMRGWPPSRVVRFAQRYDWDVAVVSSP